MRAHKNLTLKEANNLISKYPAAGNVPQTLLQNNRVDLILGIKAVTLQILLGTARSCSTLRTRRFTPLFGRGAPGHKLLADGETLVGGSCTSPSAESVAQVSAAQVWGFHRDGPPGSFRRGRAASESCSACGSGQPSPCHPCCKHHDTKNSCVVGVRAFQGRYFGDRMQMGSSSKQV